MDFLRLIKEKIRNFLDKHRRLNLIIQNLYYTLLPVCGKNNCFAINGVKYRCRYSIRGNTNQIYIGEGSVIKNTEFHIFGSNNKIIVGSNCKMIQRGSFWIDGNDNEIIIGDGTSIQSAHLCAQGEASKIQIGKDCMLSNTIQIRTSDSHPIYDKNTRTLLNPEGNVIIESHVWIAAEATIMKNVRIGSGSIIGFGSIVTKDVPANSMAVGIPARVVKSDIVWKRSKDASFPLEYV